METGREQFVAIQRGRKATRIISYLDHAIGAPIVTSDIAGWSDDRWAHAFSAAGETFNVQDPQPTINAILNRVAVRDRVRSARLAKAS